MKAKVINYIDFIIFYAKAKLEAESFRNQAGYFWWILDPLFSLAIYYFLFKIILQRGGPDYIQFLFIGLITWKWFSESVSKCSNSIIGNLGIVKKIKVNKHVFPVVDSLYHTWKFLVIFVVVFVSYLFMSHGFTIYHLWIIPILIIQYILIIGLSFFLTSIIPMFPDLKFFVTYSLRLMFYPSGVIFSLDHVPAEYMHLIDINPMAGLINDYRLIMMHGKAPEITPILYSLFLGLFLGGVGLSIMKKYDKEYGKLS